MKELKNRPIQGWKQQNIQFFVCIPSAKCGAVAFFLTSVICLIFGITLLSYANEIKEYNFCFEGSSIIPIENIETPIFIYLKFANYYQNYRIYAKSLSLLQLEGENDPNLNTFCSPIVKLSDLDYSGEIYNYKNTLLLDQSITANPCGLIAASFINYSIVIENSQNLIEIDSSGIEWNSFYFDQYKNTGDQEYINKENNHFKVWMRTAAKNSFLKFYGKITNFPSGDYNFTIIKGLDFLGTDPKPCLLLSTANMMGGKNFLLGWLMLGSGVVSFIWVVILGLTNKYVPQPSLESTFNIQELIS